MVRILRDLVTFKDAGDCYWRVGFLRREGLSDQCLGRSVGVKARWWGPGES